MSLCIPHRPAPIFGRGFITFYEKSEKIMVKGGRDRKEEEEEKGGRGEREEGKRLPLELKIFALWRQPRE